MMGKSHDEVMIEYFRKHPAFAASLVNDILEDGSDQGELKYVFRHITGAGLRVSLVPAKAKARARAKAGAANPAAKRARQAPAAKRATAAKPTKRAAPATKRAKTAPTALPAAAGRSLSRAPMAAAGR